jgi:hypothetical protein
LPRLPYQDTARRPTRRELRPEPSAPSLHKLEAPSPGPDHHREAAILPASYQKGFVMSSHLHDLINALDEGISTIQRLAEIGPALDDGGSTYFPNAIEILSLIAREAGHLEKLSTQLANLILPPRVIGEGQP